MALLTSLSVHVSADLVGELSAEPLHVGFLLGGLWRFDRFGRQPVAGVVHVMVEEVWGAAHLPEPVVVALEWVDLFV